jgi:hypothetical protein
LRVINLAMIHRVAVSGRWARRVVMAWAIAEADVTRAPKGLGITLAPPARQQMTERTRPAFPSLRVDLAGASQMLAHQHSIEERTTTSPASPNIRPQRSMTRPDLGTALMRLIMMRANLPLQLLPRTLP